MLVLSERKVTVVSAQNMMPLLMFQHMAYRYVSPLQCSVSWVVYQQGKH